MICIYKPLHVVGIVLTSPVEVYCFNISVIYFTVNRIYHDRSMHKAVHYHFVREHVVHGDLFFWHVPVKIQLVDIFIKGLSSQ